MNFQTTFKQISINKSGLAGPQGFIAKEKITQWYTGGDEYNLALGQRRAEAVSDYFVLNGISPDRITVKSYGEERPIEFGQDEKSYSKNRRVEIN